MESHAEAVRLADAKAARMLGVIAANIMKNPGEPKFRRLRSGNAKIAALLATPGASSLLASAGFSETTDEAGTAFLELTAAPDVAGAAAGAMLRALRGGDFALSSVLAGSHGGTVRGLAALPGGGVATGERHVEKRT